MLNTEKGEQTVSWQIKKALVSDVSPVADLFLKSFQETVVHFFGRDVPTSRPLEDFFFFLVKEAPGSFHVAWETASGRLAGYIITPANLPRLWFRAVLGGYVWRWAYSYLRGDYRLGFQVVWKVVLNKFSFWRHSRSLPAYRGQVLSLAVAPAFQGQGLGKLLLEEGLHYLQEKGCKRVKLEVRPWNKEALQLYSSHGFTPAGTTRDSQGEWLVMTKQLK